MTSSTSVPSARRTTCRGAVPGSAVLPDARLSGEGSDDMITWKGFRQEENSFKTYAEWIVLSPLTLGQRTSIRIGAVSGRQSMPCA